MTVADALRGVVRLGLDTAPLIYHVENHPTFSALTTPFFAAIDAGQVDACTSALSLTETLIHPLRNNDPARCLLFRNLLLASQNLITLPVTASIAESFADLRARYNLRTPDAVQVATALDAGCDAFLTNDVGLRRVVEIRVIVLSEIIV